MKQVQCLFKSETINLFSDDTDFVSFQKTRIPCKAFSWKFKKKFTQRSACLPLTKGQDFFLEDVIFQHLYSSKWNLIFEC